MAWNRARSSCLSFRRKELGGRAGQGLGLDLEPDQALGADAGDRLGEPVQVLAAVAAPAAGHADATDAVAGITGVLEDLELGFRRDVGDVLELEPEPQVGAIAAEAFDDVVIVEPGQGKLRAPRR